MSAQPPSLLKTFDNPNPERDYTIHIDTPEFTCLCPVTGQPDFADIQIEYSPDRLCVELKSLKFYFWSFREQGAYHEAVTNQMLNDLVELLEPRYLRINADFNVRGGLYTSVTVEHRDPGWFDSDSVHLP